MSILARYVGVSSEELSALLADPAPVPELLDELPATASFGPLLSADAVRERLERLSPQVLSSALQGMDPRLQEELAKPLGVVREALGSEEGGQALFRLMEQRGLIRADQQGSRPRSAHPALSLDKAWHGLHFLLCGEAEPAAGPLGSAILGGTEIGDDDLGYGPARYFDSDQVAEIAAALGRGELEQELESRYDPGRMTELQIYPGGWHQSGPDWLLDAFRDLRAFFLNAAEQRHAVLTCFV